MSELLRFENVGKRYHIHDRDRSLALRLLKIIGEPPRLVDAVQKMSFSLGSGEALGLMGPNGSGKTTLLRLAAGVSHPSSGRIIRRGRTAAVLGSAVAMHPELSGIENVLLNGTLHGLSLSEVRERLDSILDFAKLGDFIHAPVQTYSSGMCARLGVSLAIHADFDIIIVDEVLEVGDEEFRGRMRERFRLFLKSGKSILFATHSEALVKALGADVITLERGWSP